MQSIRLFHTRRPFAASFLLVVFCLILGLGAANAQQGNFDANGEEQLVSLINQARAEQGFPPLAVDERLTQAARKHTQLMVEHAALSHQFDGEPSLQTRFSDEHLSSDREGENVDLDQNIASAHEALMQSPLHRRSILDPDFNVVGVGILRSGAQIYVTEDFAHKLPQYSEPEAEASLQAAIEQYAKSRELRVPPPRPQSQLRHIACDMALNDSLDTLDAVRLPGVHDVLAWTAGDPQKLPQGVGKILTPQPAGYSLGVCFAPSISHPGGVYWIVMVTY